MTQADYEEQNRAKASFDDTYMAPTPHPYMCKMGAMGYRMAEYMHPFLSAVVDASANPDAPVKVLDVGCSYGMSGALLKTHCTYEELAAFYTRDAIVEDPACVTASRQWLQAHHAHTDVEVVGFDSSEPAIAFARASKMIDDGIVQDLERDESSLTSEETRTIQECDVLFSTGAVGYVTNKTVSPILDEIGHEGHGALGPVAVMSVLELFEPKVIAETFTKHGFRFAQLPIQMPQRRFVDTAERDRVLETLQQRGLTTDVQEAENKMFAVLCVAAKPEHLDALTLCVTDISDELPADIIERSEAPIVFPN
jgi:SAM-dependent methyltransferase